MSVTSYNSWAEIHHQFPVEEINHLDMSGKVGYVEVKSLGQLDGGDAASVNMKGWWRDNRPLPGSVISGYFKVACTGRGMELTWDRDQVSVAPGDPSGDADYAARHFTNLAMQVQAFGLVTSSGDSMFTITGQTYIFDDKRPFEITFVSDGGVDGSGLPRCGTFAGGLGVITSTANGVTARLLQIQDDVPHGSNPQASVGSNGRSLSSSWSSAWKKGKSVGSSASSAVLRPLSVRNDVGAPGGSAGSTGTGTAASDSRSKAALVSARNTFCISVYRFLIMDVKVGQDDTCVVARTVTTQQDVIDFRMRWPFAQPPVADGVYTMSGRVGMDSDGFVFEPFRERVELRPGEAGTEDYLQEQLPREPWAVRASGRVVESKPRSFIIESRVETAYGLLTTMTRWLIPDTKRWRGYKPVEEEDFVSARGAVQTVTEVEGKGLAVVAGVDELQNSVREVTSAGGGSVPGGLQNTRTQAWKTRSQIGASPPKNGNSWATTARSASTTRSGSSSARSDSEGTSNITGRGHDGNGGVMTESGFAQLLRKHGREEGGDGPAKRARTDGVAGEGLMNGRSAEDSGSS
ncbi:hypothetical protein A4X13_0g302 [Tilletia indica]|uniref:Uncharacterized protein n=1 Tax=Tilletia indica TaxID=43049 RepID=A0A177TTD3_9BASI|nr:hypothetical protein A4X13_0g302 [Tilletia indica]